MLMHPRYIDTPWNRDGDRRAISDDGNFTKICTRSTLDKRTPRVRYTYTHTHEYGKTQVDGGAISPKAGYGLLQLSYVMQWRGSSSIPRKSPRFETFI